MYAVFIDSSLLVSPAQLAVRRELNSYSNSRFNGLVLFTVLMYAAVADNYIFLKYHV